VHVGHLAIANYMVEFTDIDKVWFVLSPQNPLKEKKTLLPDRQRYDILFEAVKDEYRFEICDIEFRMPKPSFTIDTLAYLREKHPSKEFVLIMGSDGLPTFSKWKNYEEIIKRYQRYVYPRPGIEKINLEEHLNIKLVNAPLMEISSSFIRKAIQSGKDIRHYLPSGIFDYIIKMGFYLV
jgi:nicotinate-nucleotide adenylyltransferase